MIGGEKGATGDQIARSGSLSRRGRRPPWGDSLGGKPIGRQVWIFDEKIDHDEQDLAKEQHLRMLRLLDYYGIVGGDQQYPLALGLVPPPELSWYQLSLRLASELDASLTTVDVPQPPKTARRWRGIDGKVLLTLIEALQENRPSRSVRWCLREVQKNNRRLARYSLNELNVRYHEAKSRFRGTKKARKQKPAS
jgi:hypothetical protein